MIAPSRTRWRSLLVGTLLCSVWPHAGTAQITTVRDLSFGTVISGTPKTIQPTDATAAMFEVKKTLALVNIISFTVIAPTSNGTPLPVTLCASCGRWRLNNTNPGTATEFNPNSGFSLILTLLSTLYIWVGGTTSPPLSQPAGDYTGGLLVMSIAGLI